MGSLLVFIQEENIMAELLNDVNNIIENILSSLHSFKFKLDLLLDNWLSVVVSSQP